MSRVLQAVRTTPWAIQESALETIMEIASREHQVTPESIERMRADRLADTARATIRDGVAVIPVRGPLFRYANLFTSFSGATSMEVLANDIGTALKDPKVHHIILEVDSPGGMANGAGELAQLIYDARGEKPITAFISGFGASAAYYVASAADRVLASPSAIVGSIGTILEVVDFKKADEAEGIRRMTFVSAQSPRKRMDPFDEDKSRRDDARSAVQTLVDDLSAVMIEDIARNRGTTIDSILDDYGQGGVFVGPAALEAGVVDGLTTLEELVNQIVQDRRPGGVGGLRPAAGTKEPRLTDNTEGSMSDSKDTPAAEKQPVIDRAHLEAHHAELVAAMHGEAATAERERITKIQALHGPDELKAECVADPTCSVGDAAVKINAAQSAGDKARAKLHLAGRTAAEAELDAPGPSGDPAASDDVSKIVARSRHLHEAMTGDSPPARA